MVDAPNGQIRIRKWPRKRGRPKSEAVRQQNEWFAAATRIIKLIAPGQQRIAIEATSKTGLYPRDLLMRQMITGTVDVHFPDGRVLSTRRAKVTPVSFQGARLERSSVLNLTAFVWLSVPWQTPRLDTADLWDIATPQWLTIPPGINVAEFSAGLYDGSNVTGNMILQIERADGLIIAGANPHADGGEMANVTSGPIPVLEGEQYQVRAIAAVSRSIDAIPATFFSITISS